MKKDRLNYLHRNMNRESETTAEKSGGKEATTKKKGESLDAERTGAGKADPAEDVS